MDTALGPLPVLYCDPYLIAVHKPAGMLVHRTALDAHEGRAAVQCVRRALGRPVAAVHRLDKAASGVLVFALDRAAGRDLAAAFARREIGKTYLAVVRGWPAAEGTIDHALRRIVETPGRVTPVEEPALQVAQTRYVRLGAVELPHRVDRYPTSRYALLAVTPVTGRRHQIRRHLKHISHPIIGDTTYGKGRHNRLFETLFGTRRLLLACVELAFTHPVTGAPLVLSAPLADEFAPLVHRLGWTDRVAARWLDGPR